MCLKSVPDLPIDWDNEIYAERCALTSPNGDGIYFFSRDKILELICKSNECYWTVKSQRLSVERDMPVCMYISPDLANCS